MRGKCREFGILEEGYGKGAFPSSPSPWVAVVPAPGNPQLYLLQSCDTSDQLLFLNIAFGEVLCSE